jgi:DNA-binding MarR family transcriptional regulator
MHVPTAEVANLLGALALHVTGQVRTEVTKRASGGGVLADALIVVKDQPGCTVDWLGQVLQVSQPGAVHVVRKLSDAGWVDKRRGADARSKALHLTAEGARVAAEILSARQRVLLDLVERLAPQQRAALAGIAAALLGPPTEDERSLARLCRLCDRSCCEHCPVHAALPLRPI